MNTPTIAPSLRRGSAVFACLLVLNGCAGVDEDGSEVDLVEEDLVDEDLAEEDLADEDLSDEDPHDAALGDIEDEKLRPPFCEDVCTPTGTCNDACYYNGGWTTCADSPFACVAPPVDTFCDIFDDEVVTIRTTHGKYLYQENIQVVQMPAGEGQADGYEYTIRCQSDGKVAFETSNGRYLSARTDYNYRVLVVDQLASWEKWRPLSQSGGQWAFKSAHGNYMKARGWPYYYDIRHTSSITDNHKFTVTSL